jgi:hypothetical protein
MPIKTDLQTMTGEGASSATPETPDILAAATKPAPPAFTPDVSLDDDGACFPKDNWALERCGFKQGRAVLDARPDEDPGPIAVIDVGSGAVDDPCLSRAEIQELSSGVDLSTAIHAADVAGVIVSACRAKILMYNVAKTGGLDMQLIFEALEAARKSGARVINLSIGWHESETKLNNEVKACLDAGIVIVAAMGESEEPSDIVSYPAAIPGVIAVGATDQHDRRLPGSAVGNHIWLAAPGANIPTIGAATRQGTSFATALVSAAAWLAVRAQPKWSSDEIRNALAESTDATLVDDCPKQLAAQIQPPNGKWNPAIGCGRLDVKKLAAALPTNPQQSADLSVVGAS